MNAAREKAVRPWEHYDEDLESTVQPVPEAEMRAIDHALELHPVSIRLPKALIEQLKLIGRAHGVGYQPLVRDVLSRFARSELRSLVEQYEAARKAQEELQDADSPAAKFFEGEVRKRARA